LASRPRPAAAGGGRMTDNSNLLHIGDGPIRLCRIGSNSPCQFRLARRNGELVLQAGYQWHEGNAFGVEWKDIPIVDLDEEACND